MAEQGGIIMRIPNHATVSAIPMEIRYREQSSLIFGSPPRFYPKRRLPWPTHASPRCTSA